MVAKLSTEGTDRLRAIDTELGAHGDARAEGAADSAVVGEASRILSTVNPDAARRLMELAVGHVRNNRDAIRKVLADVLAA